jgi:flagellin-like protein
VTTPLSFYSANKVKILCYISVRPGKVPKRQRRGVSPVIATTIILAVTISLGLALWGFANSGAASSVMKYSEAIEDYGQIVREHRFVIVNMGFESDPSTGGDNIVFWIYNNGKVNATISQDHTLLTCKDAGCLSVVFNDLAQYDTNGNVVLPVIVRNDGVPVFEVTQGSLSKFSIGQLSITYDDGTSNTIRPETKLELTVMSQICDQEYQFCKQGLTQTDYRKRD